ncbi:MAG: sigma-70 family RNA polymerase sigma factor, partial [Phycisphaerae bacterium]|nr:sigma-70 family RNA polymerase sigma factor [Phycisphaerae bacterium]
RGSNRGINPMNRQLRNALRGLAAEDLGRRRRAMEPFVRSTFGLFAKCLYRYLGNEVECEDILEDVYADIWESPERVCRATSEKELVRTVYLYYMRKHLRQVYRRLHRTVALPDGDLLDAVAPQQGILDAVSQSEIQEVVRQALGRLKARERRAVEMWSEGLSYRAIANELETTVGAAKMLLYRTLIKLRETLSEYAYESG